MINKEEILKKWNDKDMSWSESALNAMEEYAQLYHESKVKNLSLSDVSNWVAVSDRLPKEEKFKMSADVLTIAGDKMSVKCYDYELMRWSGSPHVAVKYWMPLPKPPCL